MWYVVQTMAGREFAVQRQIEQFASDDVLDECFVPQYEVQKHLRGEWRTCTAVLFPGYLIVVSDRIAELQAQLKQIPQFASVLNNDGTFIPLEPHEVAWIDAFTREGAPRDRHVGRRDRRRPDRRAEGPADEPHRLDQEDQPPQADSVFGDRDVRQDDPDEDRPGDRTEAIGIGMAREG